MLPSSEGMLPENLFIRRYKCVRLMPPNSGGMLPVSWFEFNDMTSNFGMAASRGGRVPSKVVPTLLEGKLNVVMPSAVIFPSFMPSQVSHSSGVPCLPVIFLSFDQSILPLVPSSVSLTASRMLQSLISPAFCVEGVLSPSEFSGCQPVLLVHTSSITPTLIFMVAVLLPWVAVSV